MLNLHERNQNVASLPKNASLLDILRHKASSQPNQKAYIFLQNGEIESASLTYGELDRQARIIAACIQSGKGKRALLLYPSGLEFITAFFGCLYAGVVAVPVYPPKRNQKLSRLISIANDAQADLMLTTASTLADINSKRQQELELLDRLQWIATNTLTDCPDEFVPQSIAPEQLAFLQYTSGSTGTPKGVVVNHGNLIHNQQSIKEAFGHSEKTIYVVWLPLFHDMGLIGNVLQSIYLGATCILMPPVAFLMQPIRWLKAISKYRATTSGGPNFAYDLCAKKIQPEQLAGIDLSSWDLAFNGAEPIRAETIKQFRQKFAQCGFNHSAFHPCYGMAENTLLTTGGNKNRLPIIKAVKTEDLAQNLVVEQKVASSPSRSFVGCGHSFMDTKVITVDPKLLTPCQPGQVGEIWISGGSVASGYWNNPQATQETFQAVLNSDHEGSFLRTGDLGFFSGGELFITGRLKDVIIIRGRNHYPQDIELTIENSHPALREHCSAAFSVEVQGEERLVITCEVQRTYLRNLDTAEIVGKIRKIVSEEHDLQVYAVVLLKTGSILKTSSGKIQRHGCKAKFLSGDLNVVGEWIMELKEVNALASPTALEMRLEQSENNERQQLISNQAEAPENLLTPKTIPTEAEIAAWLMSSLAGALNVSPDEINVNESFADYGIDSSATVSITGDLAKWLGIELEPTLFWEYPNIKAVISYVMEELS